MTSNIGSQKIHQMGGRNEEEMRKSVMNELRAHFRPEFLNRVDDIVIFHPLGLPELVKIIEIQLKNLQVRLTEKQIRLRFTDKAKNYLAQAGYDPVFGARPLKRVIQRDVLNPISIKLLEGTFREGDEIEVDLNTQQQLTFKTAKAVEQKNH